MQSISIPSISPKYDPLPIFTSICNNVLANDVAVPKVFGAWLVILHCLTYPLPRVEMKTTSVMPQARDTPPIPDPVEGGRIFLVLSMMTAPSFLEVTGDFQTPRTPEMPPRGIWGWTRKTPLTTTTSTTTTEAPMTRPSHTAKRGRIALYHPELSALDLWTTIPSPLVPWCSTVGGTSTTWFCLDPHLCTEECDLDPQTSLVLTPLSRPILVPTLALLVPCRHTWLPCRITTDTCPLLPLGEWFLHHSTLLHRVTLLGHTPT